jgi:hypothetical protein
VRDGPLITELLAIRNAIGGALSAPSMPTQGKGTWSPHGSTRAARSPDEEGRAITLFFLPGRVDSYPTGTIDSSDSVHEDDTSDSEGGIEH